METEPWLEEILNEFDYDQDAWDYDPFSPDAEIWEEIEDDE